MRPSSIIFSIARRDATPAVASAFWMRSVTGSMNRRFVRGRRLCGFGWRGTGWRFGGCFRRRLHAELRERSFELREVLDLRQRRQLIERFQREIVEQLL